MLTYLIRESVISNRIESVTDGIVTRSALQSVLAVLVLGTMFVFIFIQMRKNDQLALEKETSEAKNKIKRQEMEQRLALQEQLLAQKAERDQQAKMIAALASDYRGVYYLELDRNWGICYQSRKDLAGFNTGDEFEYLESVTAYCNRYVLEPYREEFMRFVQPDSIREGLKESLVISYRYMISIDGKESYEAVRFAGVRHPEDRDDHLVHNVGACFADVDEETRKALEQQQALADALKTAEEASKAKTAFLSNMSHEIRTPMNAIIGLNGIALNEPDLPPKIEDYLHQIDTSAQHLLGIINDILDMSRIESGRMTIKDEEFSFAKNLEQVNTIISGQCADKDLRYECRTIGKIDDRYVGDGTKLKQVMINILGNAVKFTPAGGTVTFLIEERGRLYHKVALRLTFQDTGIGMSEEYLPHLFDPFSQEDSSATSKYGSTGLGLPITKSIVELMNGSIEVQSTKGVGTTFVVTVTLGESEHKDLAMEGHIDPQELGQYRPRGPTGRRRHLCGKASVCHQRTRRV
ncbi:MAG: ATP-binding protein [Coriobacteriales bacterium]|nr:ATP-binding protein [Coriobacteriales bacterium]